MKTLCTDPNSNARSIIKDKGEDAFSCHIPGRKDSEMFMKRKTDDELIFEILSVVSEIPKGNVATYGQIARLTGHPKNARLVGKVLSVSGCYGNFPCHRVVDHSGRLVPGWKEQARLLEHEGVKLKDSDHVDIKLYIWKCPE
jgi:methylated-DNA-protein-cysteine methyltransferase-like protein